MRQNTSELEVGSAKLDTVHAQGVIHRDIKPDNCLLTEDDTLKLVDFGVSEMFEKSSDMKIAKTAGSPAFMAPELCMVKKEGVYGKPADIWSMGVTLYCLLFGHVPFQKSNMMELYESIVNDDVPMPDGCSPEARDLLSRLLEKNPERRITMPDLRVCIIPDPLFSSPKLTVRQEHPWVTRSGVDPLLPTEENCASQISPPTEEEKNAAITGNMGRLMAVVSILISPQCAISLIQLCSSKRQTSSSSCWNAVTLNCSKAFSVAPPEWSRLRRRCRRPTAQGQASRVRFAVTLSATTTLRKSREEYQVLEYFVRCEHHFVTFGCNVLTSFKKDVDREANNISSKLKAMSIGRRLTEEEPQSTAGTETLPSAAQEHAHDHDEECDEPRRHTYDDHTKGHAHDVLRDHIFVNIGQGPNGDEADQPEHEDSYFVSESPPPTDESVFEKAYQKEVQSIQTSGRSSTIYSTRRIDSSKAARRAGAFAGAVGRAMQRGGEALQRYEEKSKEVGEQ